MSRPYRLAPGIHVAYWEDEGVVLDLVGDRYLGLTAESARMWRDLWVDRTGEEVVSRLMARSGIGQIAARRAVERQLAVWRQAGLVVANDEGTMAPPGLPEARTAHTSRSALAGSAIARVRPSAICALQLLRAGALRAVSRGRGLPAKLRAIQAAPAAPHNEANGMKLLRVVRTYRLLRRLFSAGDFDCLNRSLALARVLRWYGIDAQIYFGVAKHPFGAHAWVQVDDVVVNDELDRVHDFAVIVAF